jgi:predicted metal-dependent phosphoesterase TrpH
MNRHEIDLDQYEADFLKLQEYESAAMEDLERTYGMEQWYPTAYERRYLPGLRLAGIRKKDRNILLNTADLHIHTQWSDGDDLEKVLAQALHMRLDAIAITDHDEIAGAIEARRRAHERRLPLAIVPGTEISSADGHIGALFVLKTFPKGLSARETVHLIHEAGGIAVAHHPYSPRWLDLMVRSRLGCGDLIREIAFDAIECTNAVPGSGVRYNIAAIEAMRRAHIVVAVTGGSDAHNARFVGKGKTYYAGNEGIASLRHSLLYGFTQGAEGYWKTREKVVYYLTLVRNIIRNVSRGNASVN